MESMNLSEFDRLPLHKLVYNKLRDSILSGDLYPGQKLIENEISKQLKISKTPIREAIRELSQEGLLLHHTRRGITVIDFTEKDVEEIIVLRAHIEQLGVQLALKNLTEEDYTHMVKMIQQLGAYEEQNDYKKVSEMDMNFHRFLMEKSGNSRLLKAWQTIASQMQVLLLMIDFYALSTGYSANNHIKLLENIKSNNHTVVENMIKEHILKAKVLILDKYHLVKRKNAQEDY